MADKAFGKENPKRAISVRNGNGRGTNESSAGGISRLLFSVAKGALLGIATASALLIILSVSAVFYDIPDTVLNYMIIAVSVVCLFTVGYKAAGYNTKNGLFTGILTGLAYTILLYAAACILWGIPRLSTEVIIDLAAGSVISGLGGFVGVNRRGKRKRK